MPSIKVRKNNGELVLFDQQKLYDALKRSGASRALIQIVMEKVNKELYEGIPTKKIFKLAYTILRNHSDKSAGRYQLKKAILKLGPSGYPFEHFIAKLFEQEGYTAKTGEIIQGRCVRHEVDVVAEKENTLIMAECKFHRSEGTKSDVKISLYVRSRFIDIEDALFADGSKEGVIFQPMLITNTRLTQDAIQYGKCSGMKLLSWDYPAGNSLKDWIDKAHLFPITVLKTLLKKETEALLNQGIVLCKELVDHEDKLLELGMTRNRLTKLKKEVKAVLTSS